MKKRLFFFLFFYWNGKSDIRQYQKFNQNDFLAKNTLLIQIIVMLSLLHSIHFTRLCRLIVIGFCLVGRVTRGLYVFKKLHVLHSITLLERRRRGGGSTKKKKYKKIMIQQPVAFPSLPIVFQDSGTLKSHSFCCLCIHVCYTT